MFIYITLFKDSYKIYICTWFIFCLFFSICYKSQPYFSKTEIILYGDKIEIKKRRKKIYICIQKLRKLNIMKKE